MFLNCKQNAVFLYLFSKQVNKTPIFFTYLTPYEQPKKHPPQRLVPQKIRGFSEKQ